MKEALALFYSFDGVAFMPAWAMVFKYASVIFILTPVPCMDDDPENIHQLVFIISAGTANVTHASYADAVYFASHIVLMKKAGNQ